MKYVIIFLTAMFLGVLFANFWNDIHLAGLCKTRGEGIYFSKYGFSVTCSSFTEDVATHMQDRKEAF